MKRWLAVLSLMATMAWAAGPFDAQRASVRALRTQLGALRADQLAKRNELSTVSGRIETLKAAQSGPLSAGSELDAALKRSQELSGSLTDLAQKLSGRETELEAASSALAEALSTDLTRLRAQFDRETDRHTRKSLIAQMKSLRVERDSLRSALPPSKGLAFGQLTPSDDPEELLEQAEFVRDNEEKVRRELKQLEVRLAERREETELDRRVNRFMGEESMFDDQDRRLRLQRTDVTPTRATQPEADARSNSTANPTPVPVDEVKTNSTFAAGAGESSPLAPKSLGAQADSTSFQSGSAPPRDNNTGGNSLDPVNSVRITSGSDARPQIGSTAGLDSEEGDLAELEAERNRLQKLAGQLQLKASELERQAAQLK